MELIKNAYGSYFYYPCQSKNKKGIIVFIHGFATNSEYHDVFIKYINNEYDYYALQLPGHGYESEDKIFKTKKIDIEKFSIYCSELIKSLNIDKFYLIGHSMGGGISVRVANILRDKIIALAAVTPMNSGLGISSLLNYKKFNPRTFKETLHLNNILYHDLTATIHNDKIDQYIERETKYQLDNREFLLRVKKDMFSLRNRKKSKEHEKILNIPTLVIAGKYDKIITLKSIIKAFNVRQKNKDFIQIEVFNSSAHLPFQEEETKYAQTIIEFFKHY